MNVIQALNFHQLVQALQIPWNQKSAGGAIMIEQCSPLPRFDLCDGLSLTLLGPPKQKLAKFYPQWAAAVRDLNVPPTLAARPKTIPTVYTGHSCQSGGYRRLNFAERREHRVALKASEGKTIKRVLFAADAHPDDTIDGAQALQQR
ncbi:hypothetical protein [Rhizobium sp. CCGE 510]|uniref:hypothetical protein n=1 Tax=Rhizobium sp. CCGE 510 TaxID=1132836 RepID=UPI0012F6BC6E|nr:hypothetical protein [Rhizobium sp. CCGE 510]